jgi:hypothetical protein
MLRYVCPSVRLSTWNNSAFIGQIFLKFTCMSGSCTKFCTTEVYLKYDEIKIHTFMLTFRVLRVK